MRIACVISSLRLGGAERQLIGLAETLLAQGHQAEIVTYHDESFYEDAVSRKGLRHTVLHTRGGNGVIRALAALDVDCMISYLVGTNLKACLAKRLNPKLKLIVSERCHNTSYHIHDWLRFVLYNRYADMVLCNNFSQEEFIHKHFPKLSGKLTTVPNFVDLETFHPAAQRPGGNNFVVAARVCSRKNTHGLIRAAALLRKEGAPSFRIDWYGVRAENDYVTKCRKAISAAGLDDCFFLHPATCDIAEHYRKADFFCLPSFYEGTSNALAEALASGLPVACGTVSDNVRYVRDGENGFLFDPHDEREMASKLREMLSLSPEERLRYSLAARRMVETGLSREAFAEGYKKILANFAL